MTTQSLASEVYDKNALNGMLRGELAAVESYNQAIRSVHKNAIRVGLERVRDEHQFAVCSLRRWVRDLREDPAPSSGMWGLFATAVTGMASIVGDIGILNTLKRGERHGESLYRAGLGNPDLPDDFRFFIGSHLLPKCQKHLRSLHQLLDLASPADTN